MRRAFFLGLVVGFLVASCGGPSPRCLPSNCSGCCDANDTCVLNGGNQACGRGGVACVVCAATDECVSGHCIDTGNGGGGGDIGGGAGGGSGGGGATGGGGGAPADSNSTQGSIARRPNGSDTNDNSVDFVFVTTPTPGAANP